MTGSGAPTGAATLRTLRQRRGLSWSDLSNGLREVARKLGMAHVASMTPDNIKRNVARWERSTKPGEQYQLLLAYFYARTAVGSLAFGPGSDFDALMSAFAELGVPETRINELRDQVTARLTTDNSGLLALLTSIRGLDAALADPRRVDDALVADLRAAVQEVDQAVGSVPFVRLQLMLGPIVEISRRLTSTTDIPRHVQSPLWQAAADAYMLAGRLAFETRDDEASTALYTAAIEAAGRLPDTWHRAAIRTSQTMRVIQNRVGRSRGQWPLGMN